MSLRVKIRNFQSLRSVDLELSGFTVVTGPSNLGKSAIVRAMSSALFGNLGDYFITDKPQKETQCAVAIVDDQTSVKWWKVRNGTGSPDRNTSLEVNGVKYTKFGREQAELTKDIGFVELEVAGQYIRPQIASQFDPIFLLSGSETEAAEVLRLLGRVDVVTEAQRLATKDAREQAQKLKIRKDDSIAAQIKAQELDWVPLRKAKLDLIRGHWDTTKYRLCIREFQIESIRKADSIHARTVPASIKEFEVPGHFTTLDKIKTALNLQVRVIPQTPNQGIVLVPKEKIDLLTKIVELAQVNKGYYETMLDRQNVDTVLKRLSFEKKQMENELGTCPTCQRTFN